MTYTTFLTTFAVLFALLSIDEPVTEDYVIAIVLTLGFCLGSIAQAIHDLKDVIKEKSNEQE